MHLVAHLITHTTSHTHRTLRVPAGSERAGWGNDGLQILRGGRMGNARTCRLVGIDDGRNAGFVRGMQSCQVCSNTRMYILDLQACVGDRGTTHYYDLHCISLLCAARIITITVCMECHYDMHNMSLRSVHYSPCSILHTLYPISHTTIGLASDPLTLSIATFSTIGVSSRHASHPPANVMVRVSVLG